MAQDPLKPKDDGKLGTPRIYPGMNKLPPTPQEGGKTDDKAKAEAADKKAKDDAEEKQKLLARVRKRMDRCIQWEAENRRAALDDLKFLAGEQWPTEIATQRNQDQRPCLTINKLPTFVNQVTNDQRQNRPSINVSPVGDRGDPEAAKMFRGMIRAIERKSHADVSYDTAFKQSAGAGWGYIRVNTGYQNVKSFLQELRIERIRNQFTVYMDPDCQEPDCADATYGFVTEMMPRDEFKEKYPDADPISFTQGGSGENFKNWMDESNIRVAEYFEIKHDKKKLVMLSNGHVGFEEDLSDEAITELDKKNVTIIDERETEVPTVMWYKLTAVDILDDRELNWTKWIPIVRVIGDELDIEGKVKLSGIVRNAKDAQRAYNYSATMEMETIALAPKAPYIGAEGQFEGHENEWKQANTKSYPYLEYKQTDLEGKQAPPVTRQPGSQPAAGWAQLKQGAAQDMMATTGIRFDATQQERTYDESGTALRELGRRVDLGSFHYIDNLARALKHVGDILIYAIPKVYDTKQAMTILREDDTEEKVQINPAAPQASMEVRDGQTGKTTKIFNPSVGEYGVTVTIGPSFATKRIESSESMMAFAKMMPETAGAIVDLIAKNQDWPGAPEMATRLAKLVAQKFPGIMTPDQKDVPPAVQAVMSQMDQQIKTLTQQLQVAAKELADREKDRAVEMDKIGKDFEAKIVKIIADMDTKMASIHQKAVASFETHISAEVKALGEKATTLISSLSAPDASGSNP